MGPTSEGILIVSEVLLSLTGQLVLLLVYYDDDPLERRAQSPREYLDIG